MVLVQQKIQRYLGMMIHADGLAGDGRPRATGRVLEVRRDDCGGARHLSR